MEEIENIKKELKRLWIFLVFALLLLLLTNYNISQMSEIQYTTLEVLGDVVDRQKMIIQAVFH